MAFTHRFVLFSSLCAVLVICLFLPGLGGGFIFDDKPNIVENVAVHLRALSLDQLVYAAYSFEPGKGSRPLAMVSFALDYWRSGLNAESFKASNLFIHALTILALALFFRRLFLLARWPGQRAAAVALLLAILWGIHPLHVSTVLYVVQRMQTLGTLFLVLAMWAYVEMRTAQIDGLRSRQYGVLTLLCWVLAFASKEDSVLLPAYTLLMELTVLQFRAAQSSLERWLRSGYLLAVLIGLGVFLLWVVPHYWHWEAYPGRGFSSFERLLTQGRVLVMYLWQAIVPLPSQMPFYYDDIVVSRGLLDPLATLPAWLLVILLIASSLVWRRKWPLVSLGVLLFFAGHIISSNVFNLELAFEHRNHLPLIGLVLAFGGGAATLYDRFVAKYVGGGVLVLLLSAAGLLLGGATVYRAYSWGEPLRFAETSIKLAPKSERAWLLLGGVYAGRSRLDPASSDFSRAVEISVEGARSTGGSPSLLSNIVIFKTIRGDVDEADWRALLERLRQVPMSVQNRNILWVMLGNADKGVSLDPEGMLELIEIVSARSWLTSAQNLRLGAYLHNNTKRPSLALPYLRRSVELTSADDPAVGVMLEELRAAGRKDWADELEMLRKSREAANVEAVTK